MTLSVSANRRFLLRDGKPFFYLADTAWELFHRLNRDDAEFYLTTRAAQKFSVIYAVALAEHGFDRPNPYGALPLQNLDPATPNDAYFQHVDWIVKRANALGLTMGFLPTWGDKWNKAWGAGPEIFTKENAETYGKWLGKRYKNDDIIWILGGDRHIENESQKEIIRAMASGLKDGDGGRHLMTFHPNGQHTSSEYFHDERWLDFNLWQTGHARDRDNWASIAADYAKTPPKPVLDGEPGYEDHPSNFDKANGYLNDYDARKAAYWAVFAGACGHTYGCHDIWQFLSPAFPPITDPRTPWREAILLPGAAQMRHLRALLESRPFLLRIPDQNFLVGDGGAGTNHRQATRDAEGKYALVYTAAGLPVTINAEKLAGETLQFWWFDPRTGAAASAGTHPKANVTLTPPSNGPENDWVLVADDAAQKFAPPGKQ